MGCAQTDAVGDPMVVGRLFFLGSEVDQVANPSLTPSLKGLLWMAWHPDPGAGPILMTNTARSRDKPGHRSHHAQDLKLDVFAGPRA